jgi:GntR family transcriptional repressor for pyruvate dehydrogenase complex
VNNFTPDEFPTLPPEAIPPSSVPAPIVASLSSAAAHRRKPARVTEEIIESLRQDIAQGRLAEGTRLPTERELAKHFGVSQPTIRESVRVLEAMGLVDVRHGSGAYVTGTTREFVAKSLETMLQIERVGILDVIDLRDVLARYSAMRAVTHGTDEDIEKIEGLSRKLDDAVATGEGQKMLDAIMAFLAAVSAAAHSPLLFVLEMALTRLVTALEMLAYEETPALWSEWMDALSTERENFVVALRARDVEATVAARTRYLDGLRARISSVPALANLRLSDAEATRVLATVGIEI